MRAKTIYEHNAFQRGRNPLNSMGIGKKVQIDNWFKEYAPHIDYDAPHIDYEIDDNLNIFISGYIDFSGIDKINLPDNLHIDGDLDLSHTYIHNLPNNLNIKGTLYIGGTYITEFPDDLNVEGEIISDYEG